MGNELERYNYDGGTSIPSINGATEKGQDGFHDPYQKPPDGFSDWAEVGRHNMEVIERAGRQQDALESNGYSYNDRTGTWSAPGRPDVNGLGGELPQGALGLQPDQRGSWGAQGQLDSGDQDPDDEYERGPYGSKMPGFGDLPSYGLFGWIKGLFHRG